MLTAVGIPMEAPIPCIARKTMNCIPVCEAPEAAMKTLTMTVPARFIFRLPTLSAMAPAMSKQQPVAKLESVSSRQAASGHGHTSRLNQA